MGLKSHYWWDHSTLDFSRMDMSSVVAILPVGAVEQHGPHLPVRVDAAINAGIIEAAVARLAPARLRCSCRQCPLASRTNTQPFRER